MMSKDELPKIKRKKFNVKKFLSLAKKVKKIFEEEEYIRKQEEKNGNKDSGRFSISY